MTGKRFSYFTDLSGIDTWIQDKKDNTRIERFRDCVGKLNELAEENEQLKSEINMLKVTIGRNEAHIKRLTETSKWHC